MFPTDIDPHTPDLIPRLARPALRDGTILKKDLPVKNVDGKKSLRIARLFFPLKAPETMHPADIATVDAVFTADDLRAVCAETSPCSNLFAH